MFGRAIGKETEPKRMLISEFNPKSSLVESYRTFRTNLEHAASFSGAKLFLVASACPREGKSLTACNMGIIMSEWGRPVLLLDADMRKSTVHNFFGVDRAPGLSEVLTGSMKWKDVVRKSGIENLHLIAAGSLPRNPAQLISSANMRNFLADIRREYDFIIMDSPAVLPTTDASILSPMVDAVLMVVRAQVTRREAVQRAISLLKNVGGNMIGCLLNGISRTRLSYYYYYYHYYYNK